MGWEETKREGDLSSGVRLLFYPKGVADHWVDMDTSERLQKRACISKAVVLT